MMSSVAIPIPTCHRLDDEKDRKQKKWDPMGMYDSVGGLDFADDLDPLSHSHQQMQEKQSC